MGDSEAEDALYRQATSGLTGVDSDCPVAGFGNPAKAPIQGKQRMEAIKGILKTVCKLVGYIALSLAACRREDFSPNTIGGKIAVIEHV